MKMPLLSLIILAIALANARAYSDYVYDEQPLVQNRFDRLIPTFYPTITPDFGLLRPTISPLIYPGVPQIHITENLSRPTEQALLIVN
jgi:hypothetical protein